MLNTHEIFFLIFIECVFHPCFSVFYVSLRGPRYVDIKHESCPALSPFLFHYIPSSKRFKAMSIYLLINEWSASVLISFFYFHSSFLIRRKSLLTSRTFRGNKKVLCCHKKLCTSFFVSTMQYVEKVIAWFCFLVIEKVFEWKIILEICLSWSDFSTGIHV